MPKHRKMDPHLKSDWIEALRSGEFEQAKDNLRGACGGFCCLGVLCEIHPEATSWQGEVSGAHYYTCDNEDSVSDCDLPAFETGPVISQAV